jgi:hypothetical protein
MNTSEKLFAAMRANPQNWRLRDLQKIAGRRNIKWHHTGSHCVFTRSDGAVLSVPAHRTIKPVYIREFVFFAEGSKHAQS